jgi:hypothetical protein
VSRDLSPFYIIHRLQNRPILTQSRGDMMMLDDNNFGLRRNLGLRW